MRELSFNEVQTVEGGAPLPPLVAGAIKGALIVGGVGAAVFVVAAAGAYLYYKYA